MTTQESPIMAMDREQSLKVITCLREVLPGHLGTDLGMGWYGVTYSPDENVSWYFDSTWGGDDSDDTGALRAYVNITSATGALTLADRFPVDAPYVWENPLKIARWIMAQIEEGIPPVSA